MKESYRKGVSHRFRPGRQRRPAEAPGAVGANQKREKGACNSLDRHLPRNVRHGVCAERGLRVGAAKVDVTPVANQPPKSYEGILDHLFSRASVSGSGTASAALITLDAGAIPDTLWQAVSKQVESELGIPAHKHPTDGHPHAHRRIQRKLRRQRSGIRSEDCVQRRLRGSGCLQQESQAFVSGDRLRGGTCDKELQRRAYQSRYSQCIL